MSAMNAIEPSRGRPWLSATSSTSGFKQHQLAARLFFRDPPELQRRIAKRDGAVERGDELRHEALNRRIRNVDETVRDELRIRKHVAQVVIDLRDGEAKLGEPVFCARRPESCRCMLASSRSATPISSTRPVRGMMRLASSGSSEKRSMLLVSRVSGFTKSQVSAK